MSKLPSKVGKVKIEVISGHDDKSYQDAAEDRLLELFSDHSSDVSKARKAILNANPDWALYYHLTPNRSNLLRWYEFEDGASVLEVGSGCGAVSEELVRNDIQVTALELTDKRTLINAHRNHKADNLKLVSGNLLNYKTNEKFDYVICIGVLEYAGTFYDTGSPYKDFLSDLKARLKPDGKLLLAIENRLGLKYWAGAREDHTGGFFEGQSGYPSGKQVQTFGKKELFRLLDSAGFNQADFYYPYPDYKTPFFVYSDLFYPGHGTSFPLGRLPTPVLDRPREQLLSEQSLMRYIEQNDLYRDFSNSFLVEAS